MKFSPIVLLALAAFASSAADQTVTNKDLGFEITLPGNWIHDEKASPLLALSYKSPVAADALHCAGITIVVKDITMLTTTKSFFDQSFVGDQSFHDDLISKQEFTLGNYVAYKCTLETKALDAKVRFHDVIYFVVAGAHGFVITTSTTVRDYDKYAKELDAIMKTFKILK